MSGPRSRRRATASAAGPRRPRALTFVALGLLLLFGVALGSRTIGAAFNAIRGFTYNRPVAATLPEQSDKPDAELQTKLTTALARYGGTVAVSVRELKSGTSASVRGDRQFGAASLFKLPILAEVMKQQRLDRLKPDQKLTVEQKHWTDGSGVLQARIGEQLTVRELTRLMIQESDNIAARVLLDAVDAESVNATMRGIGLSGTRVSDRADGESTPHVTTASDMAHLLDLVASGRLVDAETSEQTVKLLELKQANTWLGDELPWWVKVAHKWGDLQPWRHDAGVIYAPDSTLVVVVLTEGLNATEGRQAISRAAQVVFQHFNG
jgi:beta-lactamase class A